MRHHRIVKECKELVDILLKGNFVEYVCIPQRSSESSQWYVFCKIYQAVTMTVCKQNRAVSCNFWPVIISSHTSDILLFDTNVIFLPLVCGLFFSKYSLFSADKTEEDKNMFESHVHAQRTPLKWLPFLIHENKLLLNLGRLTKQQLFLHSQTFFLSVQTIFSFRLCCSLYYSPKSKKQLLTLDLTKTDSVQKSKQSMKYLSNLRKHSQHQFHAAYKDRCYIYRNFLHVILRNMISKIEYILQMN